MKQNTICYHRYIDQVAIDRFSNIMTEKLNHCKYHHEN